MTRHGVAAGACLAGYEGPRAQSEEEWPAVAELGRSIFFPKGRTYQEGARIWPIHDDARANSLSMFYAGQPVSNVMRLVRDILVRGHRLRLGYVGGVCTHPEHRGKGLASIVLEASFERLRREDVDFAYISGDRGLYFHAGANYAGTARRYRLEPGTLAVEGPGVQLRVARREETPLLATLAGGEGTRVVRPLDDFALVLGAGHCAGRPCRFEVVEWQREPLGYLLVGGPWEADEGQEVVEFAGERLALLSALALLSRGGSLWLDVPHDDPLEGLLRTAGARGQVARGGGTFKLLDFGRTLRKLAPYFQERLERELRLEVVSGGGRHVAWSGADVLQVESEDQALWLLLGRRPDAESAGVCATGVFAEVLRTCLPLPLPSLYLNMI